MKDLPGYDRWLTSPLDELDWERDQRKNEWPCEHEHTVSKYGGVACRTCRKILVEPDMPETF